MYSTIRPLSILLLSLIAIVSLGCETPGHYKNDLQAPLQEPICDASAESYIIKDSPGKGMGLFATHDLKVGDIIFSESPAILVQPPPFIPGMGFDTIEIGRRARVVFDSLSEDEQEEIMSLAAYYKPNEHLHDPNVDRLKVIFRSNAYNTGKDIGLFTKFARINHACRPNAGYAWNHSTGKRTLYAHRNITAGEEIFVSYIGLLQSKADRQARLDTYGFKCTCEACALAEAERKASDRRRRNIKESLADLERAAGEPASDAKREKRADRLAKEAVKLVESVEQEQLADYYHRAYHLAAVFTFDHPRFAEIGGRRAEAWAEMAVFYRTLGNPDADPEETQKDGSVPAGNWMQKLLGKKLGDRHNAHTFAKKDLPKQRRVIPPGSRAMTTDLVENRLNIWLNDDYIVSSLFYG